ncbi:MAG: HEAT repeat domain-containing protein [Proteobacteria bacterium]|nr:HEAT repeat domain-containing protein [Pseudomonadota bacterium]
MPSAKRWILVSGLSLASLSLYWLSKTTSNDSQVQSELASVSKFDEIRYELKVKLSQDQMGRGASTALLLVGEFRQVLLANGQYSSRWTRMDTFEVLGQDPKAGAQAILDQSVVSVFDEGKARFDHLSGQDMPEFLQRLQANLLNKILLPVPPGSLPHLEAVHEESDEIGLAQVSYQSHQDDKVYRIKRTWLSYSGPGISVESDANHFSYEYNEEARLVKMDGRLGLDLKGMRYRSEITLRMLGSDASPTPVASAPKSSLKTINISNDDHTDIEPALSYEESLKHLDALEQNSPGTEAYQIFSSLKQDLVTHPQHGDELAARILGNPSRDASSKRRLTVMFGALAQSESSHHTDLLADLSRQCPDSFCKVQAVVALSDHKNPSEQAAERVLEMAKQQGDAELQSTALLAAGSLGYKLGTKLPQLPTLFAEQLNDPNMKPLKSTILAAMGNHGDADYLPTLQTFLEAKDINQRAAAVYSLRYIPGADQNLLDMLRPNQDKVVISEAYKALEFRNLTQKDYQSLVQSSLNLKDQDLQLAAARTLLRLFQAAPSQHKEALEVFKAKADFDAVRSYLTQETQVELSP